MYEFLLILIFVIISVGFVFLALLLGKFVRPYVKDEEKITTYECGERPFSKAWFNYNPRFYIFAIIFIVFDVAVAVAMPSFVTLKYFISQNDYSGVVITLVVFMIIMVVPLTYVLIKGDLDWIKR
jgi:NADH-quinone oxidoreductase subunit A